MIRVIDFLFGSLGLSGLAGGGCEGEGARGGDQAAKGAECAQEHDVERRRRAPAAAAEAGAGEGPRICLGLGL